jgi:hypothetical protein
MTDGSYSTASVYNMQFQGSYAPFRVGKLWKAKVESKVKFIRWTTMHQKIMTANNFAARGMQHNNACPLCQQAPEDARHLLINCSSQEKSFAFCGYGLQWKDHHPLALKTNVQLPG